MYTNLSIGKSGLKSMQNKMDQLAGDLANVNTVGYKRKEISFQELLVNEIFDSEVLKSENLGDAVINVGSKSSIGTIDFEQGAILPSAGEFHLAIEGAGFFGVRDENGNLMLTRNGEFYRNENNQITDSNGYPMDINLSIPLEQWESGDVSISSTGEITGEINGQKTTLGKVVLYRPEVLDDLVSLGEGKYRPLNNTKLYTSTEQGEGFGKIIHHALEASNVDITDTMADMITTQRAYSLNAKTIQTTDDIMTMINNIKR